MLNEQISVKSFGEICPGKGSNTRTPYEHQRKAMECLDMMNKSKSPGCEDFTLYEGFGPEMHKALSSFDYSSLDELVKDFLIFSEETLEKENSVANNDLLKDKIFVITGKLKGYKNRDELKSKIESLGGKVAGSVSSKTNYLINNDANSSSAKNTSAKKLGVQIITEEEFHKIFDI